MNDLKDKKGSCLHKNINENEKIIKELSGLKDDKELFSIFKKIREDCIDIDIKIVLEFLEYENNAIRELAKEIVLSKIKFDHENNISNKVISDKLISYLKNINLDIRNLAVELLCDAVDYFLPEIGNLLKNRNEDIRIYGCQILGNSKKAESIKYIKLALNDVSINVRNCAVMALECTEVDFDILFLIDLLNREKEPWIKFSITEVINKKGSQKFLKNLLPLIDTEPDYIKLNILKIFKNHCDIKYLNVLIKKFDFSQEEIFPSFNKTVLDILNCKNIDYSDNKIIVNYLIKIAEKDKTPWNIYQAIKLLSSMKDKKNKKLYKLFKNNLTHEHPLVSTVAIEAMANYTDLDIGTIFEKFFDKKNENAIDMENIFNANFSNPISKNKKTS